MRSQVKLCNVEGCNNPIWSKGACKNHAPKKPLAKTGNLSVYMSKEGAEQFDKALKATLMREFFLDIWSKKPHKSEISGKQLGREPLSIYFHHILPKEKYPQASLDEENIIILTLDEHTNVENDIYRYEEINKRREYLKRKYSL
jgi:hypothetical protein